MYNERRGTYWWRRTAEILIRERLSFPFYTAKRQFLLVLFCDLKLYINLKHLQFVAVPLIHLIPWLPLGLHVYEIKNTVYLGFLI